MAVSHLRPRPTPEPDPEHYVGTLVGESTSREFRLAVAHERLREQDIIAVDAELRPADGEGEPKRIRVWAKVQRIERLNPLFPTEAGHELAATRTHPLDTVLSLSREMVTAVCQVLGAEQVEDDGGGKLGKLRYPPQPATTAYRPDSTAIARIVLGDLDPDAPRALDIATLANRPDVAVFVDGHAIVTRHLAILAMTGAGKSWTARRIIEQLAATNYPIVIFDPHGDYTGLADVKTISDRVHRYFARFPVFEEDAETIATIVDSLAYTMTETMRQRFDGLFRAASGFVVEDAQEMRLRRTKLVKVIGDDSIERYGLSKDLWLLSYLATAAETVSRAEDQGGKTWLREVGWADATSFTKTDAKTFEGIKKRTSRAAARLTRMEATSRKIAAAGALPLPSDRKELVKYGQISVVSLAGYHSDFQATIYSIIADGLFNARVTEELKLPVFLVLEEAHNFAPAKALSTAEQQAILTTKQIAQEGRKFGVGLLLISQRPSRLDETTLSQCNSYVIMRMANPADQNYVRRVIETLGEDEVHLLPDLDVGEALLSGQLIKFPVLVRIKPPESKGEREEEDAFETLQTAHQAMTGGR